MGANIRDDSGEDFTKSSKWFKKLAAKFIPYVHRMSALGK